MVRNRFAARPLMLLAITLGLTSCRTMQPTRDDVLAGYTPEHFTVDIAGVEQTVPWWRAFGSHQLDRLIDATFAGNLTLEQAAARLEQAEAVVRKSGADGSLNLNVQAQSASRHLSDAQGDSSETSYSLGLYASYEVDLWGKVRSTRRAAGAKLDASLFELQTVAMTISAEMAQT